MAEEEQGHRPSMHVTDYPSEPLSTREIQELRRIIEASHNATFLWIVVRNIALWFSAALAVAASYFTIPWPWRKS